jgi:hypothetical protein
MQNPATLSPTRTKQEHNERSVWRFGAREKKKKLGFWPTQAEIRTCSKKGETVGNHQKPSDPLKNAIKAGI